MKEEKLKVYTIKKKKFLLKGKRIKREEFSSVYLSLIRGEALQRVKENE